MCVVTVAMLSHPMLATIQLAQQADMAEFLEKSTCAILVAAPLFLTN